MRLYKGFNFIVHIAESEYVDIALRMTLFFVIENISDMEHII